MNEIAMFSNLIKPVTGIDWLFLDFDGTFYEYPNKYVEEYSVFLAKIVLQFGVPLSLDEAIDLANQSFARHGSSFFIFHERYGLKHDVVHNKLFNSIDKNALDGARVTSADFSNVIQQMAIISHSSHEWINDRLNCFGMKKFFPENRIFGLEDVGFNLKFQGAEAYKIVLQQTGAITEKTLMVEDTLMNLQTAKQIGLKTAYITQGKNVDAPVPDYVDYVFPYLENVIEAMNVP